MRLNRAPPPAATLVCVQSVSASPFIRTTTGSALSELTHPENVTAAPTGSPWTVNLPAWLVPPSSRSAEPPSTPPFGTLRSTASP